MRSKKNQNPIIRLYLNLIEERRLLFFAFLSSIINKILDLAPPVIIGLAVDIVAVSYTHLTLPTMIRV